ncbi:MAG: hypothetical protein LBD04_09960 [Synergistaceae bacterium]|jgi:hypothetical protein|nr:hypothetical protein [Synergistaceae bacterium]
MSKTEKTNKKLFALFFSALFLTTLSFPGEARASRLQRYRGGRDNPPEHSARGHRDGERHWSRCRVYEKLHLERRAVSGSVRGGVNTGGLVGSALRGLIEECSFSGGGLAGRMAAVGGIVGELFEGEALDCVPGPR